MPQPAQRRGVSCLEGGLIIFSPVLHAAVSTSRIVSLDQPDDHLDDHRADPKTIREVDTAAWWTGEKIIILLPNTIRHDAVQAAARILETVVCQNFTWLDATQITMSIGVAGLPSRDIDTEAKLIEAANRACKRAGNFNTCRKTPLQ